MAKGRFPQERGARSRRRGREDPGQILRGSTPPPGQGALQALEFPRPPLQAETQAVHSTACTGIWRKAARPPSGRCRGQGGALPRECEGGWGGVWEEGIFSLLLSTLQIWPWSRGRGDDVVRNPQAQLQKPRPPLWENGASAVPPLTGGAWAWRGGQTCDGVRVP